MVLLIVKNAIKTAIFGRDSVDEKRTRYTPVSTNDDPEIGLSPISPRASEASSSIYVSSSERPKPVFRIDPRIISDATIGLSDGLTVPFALTAGLSALGSTKLVMYGGLAELFAGAISMGMGGWLGAKGEADSYASLHTSTLTSVCDPSLATNLISSSLTPFSLPPSLSTALATHISTLPASTQADFILRFTYNASPPSCSRPYVSALTIALGYFFGGFLPLLPYFFVSEVGWGLRWSVAVMAVVLFGFGWGKNALSFGESESMVSEWENEGLKKGMRRGSSRKWKKWWNCTKGGFQMMMMGGLAAGAAVGAVRVLGSGET